MEIKLTTLNISPWGYLEFQIRIKISFDPLQANCDFSDFSLILSMLFVYIYDLCINHAVIYFFNDALQHSH